MQGIETKCDDCGRSFFRGRDTDMPVCSECRFVSEACDCEDCRKILRQRPAIAPPGRKDDEGKARLDLLPFAALEEVGRVLAYGARKYGEDSWRQVRPARRYLGAALRHLSAWARGEEVDIESGLPHLAHAACSVLFLIELAREERSE